MSPEDGPGSSVALEDLDAVVGNPSYIRQEELSRQYKDHLNALFRSEWPGQTLPSGRSDIYIHFFTHGAALLGTGGYQGFVTSVGWLDTDYGFRLQEFLLKNFRIIAVIESEVEKRFEDARVTTVVTLLQREPEEPARMANADRFMQLRKPLEQIYSETLRGPFNETDEGPARRTWTRCATSSSKSPTTRTPTTGGSTWFPSGCCGSWAARSPEPALQMPRMMKTLRMSCRNDPARREDIRARIY
jgi:hypothetical protein